MFLSISKYALNAAEEETIIQASYIDCNTYWKIVNKKKLF